MQHLDDLSPRWHLIQLHALVSVIQQPLVSVIQQPLVSHVQQQLAIHERQPLARCAQLLRDGIAQ